MRPVWDIAVHQLECPLGLGQSRSLDAIEPAATADSVGNFRQPRTFFREWIAPAGCLQYFIQPTGQIETFNFNNAAGQYSIFILHVWLNFIESFPGPYIGDMSYAICFRRLRGDQSLK